MSIQNDLALNTVQTINLFICTAKGRIPLEKFVFELVAFEASALKQSNSRVDDSSELECAFRGCLLKLNLCDSLLAPLPTQEELTFFITVKLRGDSAEQSSSEQREMHDKFPWMNMKRLDANLKCENALLIPLKSATLLRGAFKFQLYVEEDCELKSNELKSN